jgi:hypothetical protein
METIYIVYKVMGGLTNKPWINKLGTVKANNHASALRRAFEKYSRNYSGLTVIPTNYKG